MTDTLSMPSLTAEAPPLSLSSRPSARWRSARLSSLSDAVALLDRLEAAGVARRELVVLGPSLFAVRWRRSESP